MKEVYIISTGNIVMTKTAGAQRVINVARSLAAGDVEVYLCSLARIRDMNLECRQIASGIYFLESKEDKNNKAICPVVFLRSVHNFMKARSSDKIIYLYPTVFVLKDFFYFIYFKVLKRYRFYCDINELRITNAFPITSSEKGLMKILARLKSAIDFLLFRISELQVPFYDGIIVISTNLQKYYARYTKKILRIPILCDASKIADRRPAPRYDSGAFKICFAGSVNCRKEGFEILFEALKNVSGRREVELYLYGMLLEKDEKQLMRLTEKYDLGGKVFYMGNIEPDELLKVFPKYNLLIIPRPLIPQTRYGFSTKLSEYMISGVPVLVTDVSDNSIYIKDNCNGYIVPPGSSSLMAEKLLNIIDSYNNSAPAVVDNAINTAREQFDSVLYTSELIHFFFHTVRDKSETI